MLHKVIYCISILFIFNHTKTVAQTFDAGFFAGITASQISGDELAGFHQPGIHFGAEVSTELNSFELGFGLAFNQKGSRATSKITGANQLYTLRLNYLDIPIVLRKSFDKWRFGIGPSINILASANEADFFGSKELTVPFNTIDYTLVAQVEYQVKKKMSIRLSYGHSLLPVRKFNGNGTSFNDGQYNEWISTGVLFHL
jgi:hypothetical protein